MTPRSSASGGEALRRDPKGLVALGSRDPNSGKLVLSPSRTLPTARAYEEEFLLHPDGRTLHCYAGLLTHWNDGRYAEVEDNGVKQQLHAWLHDGAAVPLQPADQVA